MTRRTRLIATATLVGACLAAPPAYALFGVGDVVFDPSVFAQTVMTVQQLSNQLAVMQQQYNLWIGVE
jgi:conjugal transfer/entry exclusion protein